LAFGIILPCHAIEPVPRKWTHIPMDTNFVGAGYVRIESDIFTDPTFILQDVKMEKDIWAGKYIRTFELFDKSARFDLTQTYQEGKWTGLLDGVSASATRKGLSDTFVRFSMNLYGAPPLKGKQFAEYRSSKKVETIVGLGLAVRLPTGEYMEDKLINLGQNRFAFRPHVGVTHRWGKWTAELTGELSFYTENDEFFNGKKLEQDPLFFTHAHLIYSVRPGFWIGASAGYNYGGENTVDGVAKDDTKQNLAWAFSLAYPISRSVGISVKYIETNTQESTGADSEIFSAGLSYAW
jgi:outer membrane putative beta-barrel porin/alpha-amylase